MMQEVNQAKRYLGAKFGYGELIPEGEYSVPCDTSKGKAFMNLVINPDGHMGGFKLFWDEALTISWYNNPKPETFTESKFSEAFRNLEKCLD